MPTRFLTLGKRQKQIKYHYQRYLLRRFDPKTSMPFIPNKLPLEWVIIVVGIALYFFAIFDGSTKCMVEPGWYTVLHVTCNFQTSLPLVFKSHRSAVRTKQRDQSRAPNHLSGHCRMRYYHYLATFIPSGHPTMHVIR